MSLNLRTQPLTSPMMGAPIEAEMLTRCVQGEPEAWDQLMDRHYAATGRFIYQLGHDFTREDVEEICQETFLTVVKSLHTFKGNSQFQTWLFRIAANKARDYRQRQHAAKRGGHALTLSIHDTDPIHGAPIDPPSNLPSPDWSLIQNENIGLIAQALELLAESCQEIVQLRYFADLSYEEIAAALNLNPKTVSSRLSKCLDKLETIAKNLLLRENNSPTSV